MKQQMLWMLPLTIKVNLRLSSPSFRIGELYISTPCHLTLTLEWRAVVPAPSTAKGNVEQRRPLIAA